MERIGTGDRPSLGFLVERYWAPLLAYATSLVEDRDAAEDIVQNTFIRVWERGGDWSPTGAVNAYLYRITRNLCLNARRDRRLRSKKHDESGARTAGPPVLPTPEQTVEADALRREVEAAISQLSTRCREVFMLSRFHGLSHREIAEALGTSPQTVSNQMSTALDSLRKALSHLLESD